MTLEELREQKPNPMTWQMTDFEELNDQDQNLAVMDVTDEMLRQKQIERDQVIPEHLN
jgi:hypothetical protein